MEQWCQSPLNLVKKSKPVAIVAPSSIITTTKTEDDCDGEEPKTDRPENVEEGPRSKSGTTTKYHIDRLLEKDDNSEQLSSTGCPNNLYSMISDLSSTEQQVLAAIYMRDLMSNFSQNPYLRFANYGGYLSSPFMGAYENYKRLLENRLSDTSNEKDGGETEKIAEADPYPFLRERLNSRPVYAEEEKWSEETEQKEKPDYEKGIDYMLFHGSAKTEDGSKESDVKEEPLNLRVKSEEPLDFSRKSKNFVLSPNPPLSLTLNLKSPEYESLSKPLVLTIPNPQERTTKQKKKERASKSKR